MFTIKTLKLKKPSLTAVYNFLGKHYLMILGIIFSLLLCLNLLIYYQYVYLTVKAQPEPTIEKVVIDQETLEKVLNNLDIRLKNLVRVRLTSYADPFR